MTVRCLTKHPRIAKRIRGLQTHRLGHVDELARIGADTLQEGNAVA